MLLNGGELDGAPRAQGRNRQTDGRKHIGAVFGSGAQALLPRSADFTFIADGRDKWGLGFLITTDRSPRASARPDR